MGMHWNKRFLNVPPRLKGRTSSQQLSPPSSSSHCGGTLGGVGGGRHSLRSCLILMSLSSICSGNFSTVPNISLLCFRQLSLLRHRFPFPEGDRSHVMIPLVRAEDSDLGKTRVLLWLSGAGPGSVRRVMTLPQKTTSSATAVEKSVAGNSNSERCIMNSSDCCMKKRELESVELWKM